MVGKKQIGIQFWILGITMLSLIWIGCSSSSSVNSDTGTLTVGVSLAGQSGASAASSNFDGDMSPGAVIDFTLTSVKVVLSRIRFNSIGEDSLNFSSSDPRVIDLDLDGTVHNLGSVQVSPGTYDETRFRIDELDLCPNVDSCTAAHIRELESNPDMGGLSVRIEGYLNGSVDSSFIWTTDLNEEQRREMTPFTIKAGDTTMIVFDFDVSQWLSDGSGGQVDPRDPQSKSIIENNVKDAFEARQDGS